MDYVVNEKNMDFVIEESKAKSEAVNSKDAVINRYNSYLSRQNEIEKEGE